MKMHAGDIEIAIAKYFGWRRNLIVPNISWGLGFRHELDMLIVRPSGWAIEVEIKVSLSDLKADLKKQHAHYSHKIQLLYFAIPEKLQDPALTLIPERAGLFAVRINPKSMMPEAFVTKTPVINKAARKLTDKERLKLGELAVMRIWSLKKIIYRNQREFRENFAKSLPILDKEHP